MIHPLKGRGATLNKASRFNAQSVVQQFVEGLDEDLPMDNQTVVLEENAKKIINRVESTDLPFLYSSNPYQGCEHGCSYCYARPTHEYYGLSAGLDFEKKIMVKKNAATLLRKELSATHWQASPVVLSGNTDCYQPIERKYEITRSMLEVFWEFRHPVSLITKNSLVLRDRDVLKKLAAHNLVRVLISITTLDESLRQKLEPRTASVGKRFDTVRELHEANIPVGVMTAPIIPGLNDHEIPALIEKASHAGATYAGMTIVRLNGALGLIFQQWLRTHYPDREQKIWNAICSAHNGQVNDSRTGTRFRGEGKIAETIHRLFTLSVKKHMPESKLKPLNTQSFRRGGMLSLFDV